ncbi:MAG: DUF2520 domain-containing protein [Flavobacteriales bacterium]
MSHSSPSSDPVLPLRIGICGTGKVARAILERWLQIPEKVQVVWAWGRDIEKARETRNSIGGRWEVISDWTKNTKEVDWVVLAISDDAINDMTRTATDDTRFLHFSGCVSATPSGAVFWPIQAIQAQTPTEWEELPCALEMNQPEDERLLSLLKTTAPKLKRMSEEERRCGHIAAVFAANFANHTLAIAQSLIKKTDLDWNDFSPLVQNLQLPALNSSSSAAQTGPALRGDSGTLQVHLDWLKNHAAEHADVYKVLSRSIQELHNIEPLTFSHEKS